MRRILVGTVCAFLLISLISCGKAVSPETGSSETGDVSKQPESSTSASQVNSGEESELRSIYPDYFDLDTSKGLEVYVWQMSENSYCFGLLPGTNCEKEFSELVMMKAASAEAMKEILATYDIDEEDVVITPWQNPISSYLPKEILHFDGESENSYQNRLALYVENIREMIF